MEFLKKNALKFLQEAEDSFARGDYSFTMFFVEQFFQLMLKYLLYRRYGDFPRTHSLKTLFDLTKDENLQKFYRDNLDLVRDIELSYIASRYMDVDYSEAVARKALNLAKRFLELVE